MLLLKKYQLQKYQLFICHVLFHNYETNMMFKPLYLTDTLFIKTSILKDM